MQVDKVAYLKTMGIQTWKLKTTFNPAIISTSELSVENSTVDLTEELTWEKLENCVKNCKACSLHEGRTQTVFGVGNQQADLVFVGEAPGANEDRLGEPFVGRAGQLLDAMMAGIGLSRQNVYIANVLKCRPPNNRDPSPEEVAQCTPFLQQQLSLLKPKLIVALGRISAHYLLKTNISLTKLRSQVHTFGETNIPLIVTFHPAYLLRSPIDKRKAYEDLLMIQKFLRNE